MTTILTAALVLSALATVSSAPGDTGCTAGYGGTCHALSTGCTGEHPNDEWPECVVADQESCVKIPHHGSCSIDCHSASVAGSAVTPDSGPYNITLEATAASPECFTVRVRWQQPSGITGALIESVTEESYGSLQQCACLSDPDTTEFTLHGLRYDTTSSQSLTMTVKVMSLPHSEHEPLTITQSVPTNCRELPYRPGYCVPPRYTEVRNIRYTTALLGNGEEMRIHLSWKHPSTPTPFPNPSTYYILITDPMVSTLFPIKYFRVENTLNVTLPALDASKSYKIAIQPYARCAGVDKVKTGCGLKRTVDVSYTPPTHTSPASSPASSAPPPKYTSPVLKASNPASSAPLPTPEPAMMSSIASSPASTTTPGESSPPTDVRNDIILPSIITPIIIIAVIGIAVLAFTRFWWKDKKNKYPEAIFPFVTPHPPLRSTSTRTPRVCSSVSAGLPVLLIYSPESPEKEKQVLMEIIVKGLKPYDIDVTSHDVRSPRGCLSEWVEEQFQLAQAVLVVCNQDLHQEWHAQQGRGSTHTVVAALKQLVHTTVGASQFSKIAVVLLKATDEQFIPSLYLKGTRRFTVQVDKLEDVARFVKEVPVYAKP